MSCWLWLLRKFGLARNGHDAERAQREQEAKLRELQARRPAVRREVNQFAADIEAALTRRRHQ